MNKPVNTTRPRGKSRGFTLIELMVVVSIIAIIAALVYPSYRENVRKARRADAQGVMFELTQWMERFYTENGRYHETRAGTDVKTLVPTFLLASPKEGGTKFYNFALTNLAARTFTIVATPAAGQTGDKCGKLTLTQAGAKGMQSASVPVDKCW